MPWDRLFSSVIFFATCCWWWLGVYGLLSINCVTRSFGCLFAYVHCTWMCLYAWVFFQRNIIRKKCIPKFQQLDLDAAQLASYNQTCTHARIWDDRWRGMIARFILDTNVHLPRLCILYDLCRLVLDWCRVIVNRYISLWLGAHVGNSASSLKTQQRSLKNWYVNHDCQFLLSPYNIVHQTFVTNSGRSNRSMATWPSCLRVYVCKWWWWWRRSKFCVFWLPCDGWTKHMLNDSPV